MNVVCGQFLLQRRCFSSTCIVLVFIQSAVPAVRLCGQPRAGAHSILICQNVTSFGQQGKRVVGGVQHLNGKREMTLSSQRWCGQSTHEASQSVPTWSTALLPFISLQTSQRSRLSCTTACWSHSTSQSQYRRDLLTSVVVNGGDKTQ